MLLKIERLLDSSFKNHCLVKQYRMLCSAQVISKYVESTITAIPASKVNIQEITSFTFSLTLKRNFRKKIVVKSTTKKMHQIFLKRLKCVTNVDLGAIEIQVGDQKI